MLNCEKCNYVKKASGKELKCELTGFVFKKSFEDYEMANHPCFNVNLQDSEIESNIAS